MITLDDLETMRNQLAAGYMYVADVVRTGQLDHYDVHLDDVLAGRPWADDCDGYALTACTYLLDVYDTPCAMWHVVTEYGEHHAICAVECEGALRVLDCRHLHQVMRAGELPYRWLSEQAFAP